MILLGFLGAGGERTDVIAHVTGFFSGCLLERRARENSRAAFRFTRALQFAAGAFTIAAIAAAWLFAMR